MKKLLMMILIILCIPMAAQATEVSFIWDLNSENDIHAYRLYQSQNSGNFPSGWTMAAYIYHPQNMVTIDVQTGTWYWVLTAQDSEGLQSGPSNEVTAVVSHDDPVNQPPAAPTNLIFE